MLVKDARARGLEVDALLRAAHIDAAVLEDPPARIPASSQNAHWQAGARQSGDDALGLHVAEPSVAFDGVNYLVAWDGAIYENGTYPSTIQAIRVSPSTGETIEQTSIIVHRGAHVPPRVAYGNGRYLVTWNTATRISGARINASTGAVIDALAPIHFSGPVPGYAGAQAASFGDQFLVVWNTDGGQIMGNRMRGSDGAVLDGTGFTVEQSTRGMPAITFDGQDYRVSWPGLVGGAQTVMSTRVSPQGVSAPAIPLTPVTLYTSSKPFPITAAEPRATITSMLRGMRAGRRTPPGR